MVITCSFSEHSSKDFRDKENDLCRQGQTPVLNTALKKKVSSETSKFNGNSLLGRCLLTLPPHPSRAPKMQILQRKSEVWDQKVKQSTAIWVLRNVQGTERNGFQHGIMERNRFLGTDPNRFLERTGTDFLERNPIPPISPPIPHQ